MLLGRECINGVGVVPSTLHQRLSIWREDGFEKQLANIPPCISIGPGYEVQENEFFSMKLHPNVGFIWEREVVDQDYVVVNHDQVPPKETYMLKTRDATYQRLIDNTLVCPI